MKHRDGRWGCQGGGKGRKGEREPKGEGARDGDGEGGGRRERDKTRHIRPGPHKVRSEKQLVPLMLCRP